MASGENTIVAQLTANKLTTNTKIAKYWPNMPLFKRRCIYTYFGVTCMSYTFLQYNDAKISLNLYRSGQLKAIQTEWDAAYYGSKQNMGENLFSSLIFPWTWVSDEVPSIVLKMNPKKPENDIVPCVYTNLNDDAD